MEETKQNENKLASPEKQSKPEWQHWLAVGGILCAIGGVSALALTALNLVTGPIIKRNNDQKQLAGYRAIYANCQAVSDPVAIDNNANLAEYYQAYSDEGKTQLIGYIYNSKTIAVKSYGNIHAMVGISSEGDNPVLGKVYLVEDSLSYKNTFETGYVEPYNANPSDEALAAVKCGATYGATALNEIITAARDHFTANFGDSFQEPLADDAKTIWGEDLQQDLVKETYLSDHTYARKAYRFFEDETMIGEWGQLITTKYSQGSDSIRITIGFKGTETNVVWGKMAITQASVSDADALNAFVETYNAAPGESAFDSATSGSLAILKDMALDAKAAFAAAGGLQSTERNFNQIEKDYAAVSDPVVYSDKTLKNDSYGAKATAYRSWTLYSDADKTTEKAQIFKMRVKMSFDHPVVSDPNAYVPEHIESDTVYLIALSGDKATPTVDGMYTLSDSSGRHKVITEYIDGFDNTKAEDGVVGTDATYSLKGIWTGLTLAKTLYAGK